MPATNDSASALVRKRVYPMAVSFSPAPSGCYPAVPMRRGPARLRALGRARRPVFRRSVRRHYDRGSGMYMNYGTGRMCIEEGYARILQTLMARQTVTERNCRARRRAVELRWAGSGRAFEHQLWSLALLRARRAHPRRPLEPSIHVLAQEPLELLSERDQLRVCRCRRRKLAHCRAVLS